MWEANPLLQLHQPTQTATEKTRRRTREDQRSITSIIRARKERDIIAVIVAMTVKTKKEHQSIVVITIAVVAVMEKGVIERIAIIVIAAAKVDAIMTTEIPVEQECLDTTAAAAAVEEDTTTMTAEKETLHVI